MATQLSDHHSTTDLADIHLLVKRNLAAMKIGDEGVCQGEISHAFELKIEKYCIQEQRRDQVYSVSSTLQDIKEEREEV